MGWFLLFLVNHSFPGIRGATHLEGPGTTAPTFPRAAAAGITHRRAHARKPRRSATVRACHCSVEALQPSRLRTHFVRGFSREPLVAASAPVTLRPPV